MSSAYRDSLYSSWPIKIPFIAGFNLIATSIANNSGESRQPCRVPLLGLKEVVSMSLICKDVVGSLYKVSSRGIVSPAFL